MNYSLLMPEIILSVTGIFVVFAGLLIEKKKVLGYISALALLASLVQILRSGTLTGGKETFIYEALVVDPFSQLFKLIFLLVSLIVVIASIKYFENHANQDEYYSLLLLATVGMMVVASSNDLITLFVGFELASMATYVLAGFEKKNKESLEAALKYFIIGSLSSAIMLFGISIIYGLTGSTNIPAILDYFSLNQMLATGPLNIIAMILLIAGFGFKMALVPFHMWAPDTYEGSPTVVSALLAAGSKKMGFAAAFKILILAMITLRIDVHMAFAVLAVVTMTLGNIVAISQKSIKRMLAYSSIAQAGYIAIAFVVMTPMALTGGLLLALSHGLMKGGAFLAVVVVGYMVLLQNKNAKNIDHLDNFAGLGKRAPITAFSLTIFLFALAGVPPTAGFVSKFVLFSSTIESGMVWLAVIAILNSALSLYYYLRVVKYMYVLPPAGEKINEPAMYVLAILIAVAGVLAIGLYPQPFIDWSSNAASTLLR